MPVDDTNAVTLTAAAFRRHFLFEVEDDTTPPDDAITLSVPSGISRGAFAVINDTGFAVTVEITGQALMPPTIADGEAALLTSDGTNVRQAGTVISALGDIADVVLAGLAQGHMLRRNGANQWVGEETPYDLSFLLPGSYSSGALMAQVVLDRAVTFPDGLAGAQGYAGVNASATTVLDLQKNGANIGTITFTSAGSTAAFAMSGALSFAAGDRLAIVNEDPADATLADVSLTLKGKRD